MDKLLLLTTLVALSAIAPGASAADGILVRSRELPEAAHARLAQDIAKERQQKPAVFRRVAEMRARVAELDRRRRGPLAPMGPVFEQLGPDAVLPMLEMMALDGTPRADLTDTAWLALRTGLVEAVGHYRDPRAAPVLVAILDGPSSEYLVVRAAAEALGRLGDDASAAKLVRLAGAPGPKQKPVLAGMGDCRRQVIAATLAAELAARPNAELAAIIARSLGRVGNAWAWRTPAVAVFKKEQAATRAIAAKALVEAFVAYDDESVRRATSNALFVVDDPSTPALIASARHSSPRAVAALDQLAARFARNPTR